jgi:flavodoxin/ferredoxin
MKKLGIYYFSGTGNTEIAANLVSDEFKALGWEVSLMRMEDINKGRIELAIEQYDLIGFGSQVIGYGIPGIVRKFAKRLPVSVDNKKVFIFRTTGGVVPNNYNVSKLFIRILERKKYDVCYERLFSIGSNWIFKFDDAIMKQLYEATKRKIGIMCSEIVRGERHTYQTKAGLRIKMGIIAALAAKTFPFLGKDAVVEKSCTRCGLCVKNCPADNICLKNGKIKFHTSCSACMRCVYSCPNKSIRFRLFKFFTIPGGYNVKKSLFNAVNPDEKPNGKIPPFFKGYMEDDSL